MAEVLLPASDPGDAVRAAEIARTAEAATPRIFWSAGLHPHVADRWNAKLAAEVRCQLETGAVAVGETGLDYHYENAPREMQREAFAAQVAIAVDQDHPVIVHSREADHDTADILREGRIRPERVILHCFSAGPDLFREALERGYYVSFSGLITFKSYPTPELLPAVPAKRLLVETDSPYLAPVPLRRRRNEPAFLTATVARLAEARGIETAEAAAVTRANARRVYKVSDGA